MLNAHMQTGLAMHLRVRRSEILPMVTLPGRMNQRDHKTLSHSSQSDYIIVSNGAQPVYIPSREGDVKPGDYRGQGIYQIRQTSGDIPYPEEFRSKSGGLMGDEKINITKWTKCRGRIYLVS